ncbi:MAG: formylglycine-generating enzyme family protein [Prevotella sp.]|nr:formylglycine-generating enzyme family protein [Prevotella sp.]
MSRLIQLVFAVMLLAMLPMAEVIAQRIKTRKPTVNNSTTKPKQTKKKPTRSRDAILSELESNMVYVEGGTFMMGATSEQGSDAESDEKPVHQVTLSSFSICKYEVTQELWQAVMGSNPSKFKGTNHPVENVSWEDCQDFIRKLNELTSKNFRLPTEAEWEYAARGGNRSKGYKYAGGNSIGDVAWYSDNSHSTTHDVGTKRANELGLYDMSGNVFEWCQDWYGSYNSGSQTNPCGASSGSDRVLRGGSWFDFGNAGFCRVSNRSNDRPSFHNDIKGLRLAL